ncbi:MAG: chemotaxis protein CheB [Candidatus Obscuribacterales bacterium]|nr:chemotaxis protein CheB [Candidatus Obscuribacterales bacterium]
MRVNILAMNSARADALNSVFGHACEFKLRSFVFPREFSLAELENCDLLLIDAESSSQKILSCINRVMTLHPVPIVCLAGPGLSSDLLIKAGAVSVLPGELPLSELADSLPRTFKSLEGVRLVKRRKSSAAESAAVQAPHKQKRIVAIGSSTGGPQVVKQLVDILPVDYPLPVLLAQHISKGFLPNFVSWLGESGRMKVKIAESGETVAAGTLYIAADDYHMGITPNGRIIFDDGPLEYLMRPSVAFLFRSVAASYGSAAIAALLTGMGRDGGKELGLIKDSGGATIAQTKESSAVFGMPGEALRLGSCQQLLAPDAIAERLIELACAEEIPSVLKGTAESAKR